MSARHSLIKSVTGAGKEEKRGEERSRKEATVAEEIRKEQPGATGQVILL